MIASPPDPASAATDFEVLVLLAHPYPQQSRVNRLLATSAAAVPGVRVNDLYGRYPRMHIDVRHEQALLRQARLIVFQHPMYWYSAPALLKEWQDVVLSRGFAVGHSGTALHGKTFLQAITIGGSARAYSREGNHRYTVEELLRPFEQMARLCGMRQQPPLVLYDAHHCPPDAIQRHAATYVERLTAFIRGAVEASGD